MSDDENRLNLTLLGGFFSFFFWSKFRKKLVYIQAWQIPLFCTVVQLFLSEYTVRVTIVFANHMSVVLCIYRKHYSGPKIDPCGMPCREVLLSEECVLIDW